MFGFNELPTPVKAIIALALVLFLVLIAGLLLRRIAGGRIKLPGQGARTRQPRLGIIDIFEMDRQRQLILLRRDNVEHLVMIGGPNDVVIEASIVRSATRTQAPVAADVAEAKPQVDPRSEPRIEPLLPTQTGRQAAPTSTPAIPPDAPTNVERGPAPERTEDKNAAPLVVSATPSPVPPRSTPPIGAIPTTAAIATAGLVASAAAASAISSPAKAAPAQMTPAPPAASTVGNTTAEVPAQPLQEVGFDDQIAASFEAELAKLTLSDSTLSSIESEPAVPSPAIAIPAKPIIEPIAPPAAAKASARELDDMTRQLQEALQRPFSSVKTPGHVNTAAGPKNVPTAVAAMATAVAADAIAEAKPVDPDVEVAKGSDTIKALEPKAGAPSAPASVPTVDFENELAQVLAGNNVSDSALKDELAQQVERPKLETAIQEAIAQPAMEPLASEVQPILVDIDARAPTQSSSTPVPGKTEVVPDTVPQPAPSQPKPSTPDADATKVASPEIANDSTAKTAAAMPTDNDPFSVDSIEAEFARLLNRTAPPKG